MVLLLPFNASKITICPALLYPYHTHYLKQASRNSRANSSNRHLLIHALLESLIIPFHKIPDPFTEEIGLCACRDGGSRRNRGRDGNWSVGERIRCARGGK